MRKSSKRSSKAIDRSATTDVVTQLECAIRNPRAAALGALIGGLVPWFGRTLAHEEIPTVWSGGNHALALVMVAVVLGCACFSALSVYKFGRAAFGDSRKALGFVLALEGVMLVAQGATSAVALAVLILINAVANGSVIALAREATQRRCAADTRRATTRANNRGMRSHHAPVTVETASSASPRDRAPRATYHVTSHALLVPAPRTFVNFDDAIDAEIVSEQHFS